MTEPASSRNWDDAYTNGAYIADGASYPAKWAKAAEQFRHQQLQAGLAKQDIAYGPRPRNRLDLFMPQSTPQGLAVFVHGGYWMAFDKSSWSHLADGALAHGFAVALPSYTLAPEASISEITKEIAEAVAHAAQLVSGPICLGGHSAGGHLVTRMMCRNSPLPGDVRSRVAKVTSISGVHDLRPLLRTAMAQKLFRNEEEAGAESPALLEPEAGTNLTCWVGAEERPEFLRQNELLANIWSGFNVSTRAVVAPGRHHFDVIEDLTRKDSQLTREFIMAD